MEQKIIENCTDLAAMLISYNTCTNQIDPSFSNFFELQLKQLGYRVESINLNGIKHYAAIIEPKNDTKLKLAFIGHYDTVAFEARDWTKDPLGTVSTGVLYGRGASDMKSSVAAMLYAGQNLVKLGIAVTVFIPGDEETTSYGMPALLKLIGNNFDFCIGGEPTAKKKMGDTIKVGRRGVMQGTITLQGKSGHAAYAPDVDNVNNDIGKVIDCITTDWNDACFGIASTVSFTGVQSGATAYNVIPDRAELKFDARFSPNHTARQFEDLFIERLGKLARKCELNVIKRTEPYGQNHPKSEELKLATTEAIKKVTNLDANVTCDGGTSDARFMAWENVPTIEIGVPHGNMHGADEFVLLTEITELQKIFEEIATRLLK